MRPVQYVLAVIILAVAGVAYFEPRPALEDFDPASHGEFADTWSGRLHISYWEKWSGFEADACQAMTDAFNRSQDRIFVHYLRISQVDRKSTLAMVGNNPPEVVGCWTGNVIAFAEAGAIRPLDELMAEAGLKRSDYIENYLRLGEYEGRIYALPMSPASVALVYNKEHFRAKAAQLRAAGCDPDRPPRTIEELDRYAEALNEFNPDGSPRIMGFMPTEPGWFNPSWGYYFGGTLYDEAAGRLTPDNPGMIAAMRWVKRYAERYGREQLKQFRSGFGNYDSPQNAFIDGKVSMEMHGVYFPNFIRRHRPRMEFGVAPFPCAAGVPGPRSFITADMICIPQACKHPEAAWEFVRFVQTDGLPILCRLQGKHMPKNPEKVPPDFHRAHPNPDLAVFEQVAVSPHSFVLPQVVVTQEYQQELNQAFDHIWSWPVPQGELKGLTGAARQEKIEALCEAEIRKTLAEVGEKMQRKLDMSLARSKQRETGPFARRVQDGDRPPSSDAQGGRR